MRTLQKDCFHKTRVQHTCQCGYGDVVIIYIYTYKNTTVQYNKVPLGRSPTLSVPWQFYADPTISALC
jgi:hypothetical protein